MVRKEHPELVEDLMADIRRFAAQCGELMFNERDYQMRLALFLLKSGRYQDVDVEYFIPNSLARNAGYEWNSDLRLDIVAKRAGRFAVTELKYPTRRAVSDIERFGQVIEGVEIMKNQSAQDLVSYNFWKDVRRVEIIKRLFPASVEGGVAAMLTNDPYYTRGARPGSVSAPFSTAGGRTDITGRMDWARPNASSESHPGFSLDGRYSVCWDTFEIDNNTFYQTIIPII